MDVLFLKENIDAVALQLSDRFQQGNRIPGEAGDRFCDDCIDRSRAAGGDHFLKALPRILGPGLGLVREHACVLPSGMALDQAAVIADLCRQGMVHGVLRGGDPRVSGHTRQLGQGRFCERDPFYYSVHVCLLCIKLGVLYLSL